MRESRKDGKREERSGKQRIKEEWSMTKSRKHKKREDKRQATNGRGKDHEEKQEGWEKGKKEETTNKRGMGHEGKQKGLGRERKRDKQHTPVKEAENSNKTRLVIGKVIEKR